MKKRKAAFAMLCCHVGIAASSTARADALPLWEAGLGAAGITLPNYRGSDQTSTYVLPAPYFVYRGDFLKADRNGVRTRVFNNEHVDINLSLNATLPVQSKNNTVRRGMSDLRPTVELGPTASVNLWNSEDRKTRLDFRAPLRTAITIESSPKQIGWLFAPNLNIDVRDPGGFGGWNLGMLAGPLFSSRDYNAYFYSVNPSEAAPDRPAYAARGGYSGMQFTTAVSKRFPGYWVGGFLRYDTLSGAVFEDSPLVRKRGAVSAGIAISWIFGQSSRMVDARE